MTNVKIKCINIVGYSNSGKTTILKKLSTKLEGSLISGSFSVAIAYYLNKTIAIVFEGDTVPIIYKHFSLLRDIKVDFLVCTSHTGKTLDSIFQQCVNLRMSKTIDDAKDSTILIFKQKDNESHDEQNAETIAWLIKSYLEES